MNPAVLCLVGEKECHSDDEELADGSGYIVHDKPGRDAPVKALFEALTIRGESAMNHARKKGAW